MGEKSRLESEDSPDKRKTTLQKGKASKLQHQQHKNNNTHANRRSIHRREITQKNHKKNYWSSTMSA
ncbi:hypothetical protein Scep_015495 [Stephania cephalantha]|uniref:Uncharacterized protein n=1 Tax=Stephania cephalantha TaxID=152367 RepID=A0AAP0J3A8_9MAGN